MELDTIYNMDCLEGMKELSDASIDMILCDLPYGTTENAWDVKIDLAELWKQYRRITKENAAIVLFSQMPFTAELVMSNPREFRYEWIWEKNISTGFLNAKKMPLKAHENILVFYRKLPTYHAQMLTGFSPYFRARNGKGSTNYRTNLPGFISQSIDGSRYPNDILRFPVSHGLHPTEKPVPLLEYLIRTYTDAGETVLDNCMGSGSTAIAAMNTGRRFIGFETDIKYFCTAKARIEAVRDTPRLDLLDDYTVKEAGSLEDMGEHQETLFAQ